MGRRGQPLVIEQRSVCVLVQAQDEAGFWCNALQFEDSRRGRTRAFRHADTLRDELGPDRRVRVVRVGGNGKRQPLGKRSGEGV